jgi:arylsulfatase A-like enzyme
MKQLVTTLVLLSVLMAGYAQKSKRPHVIVILSDDQGYGDFSIHGNPVLKTPALDRLHDEGIRFSNFHVAPLCTPTRGQLLSGLDALNNKASTVLTGRGVMRRDISIMPEVFHDNGYRTGIFGKWHLGDTYPDRPMDRGFDKSIWTKGWGLLSETEFDNDYYKTRYMDSVVTKYSNKYCTDLWFDEAISWMEKEKDKGAPLFTYIALNAPHGPFHALPEDVATYRNKVPDETAANFFGMIANIDRNMQKLDQWLQRTGLKENTIVVFMNDNGGTGGVTVYNAGMRGKKGSVYDGGHRAACFIRWPGAGWGKPRTVTEAAMIQDLLPTFIDLLGFTKNTGKSYDGASLTALLRRPGKKITDRMLVVQYTGDNKPEKYFSCVVWNNWRLVGENELYDLGSDPAQEKNVAAMHPAIAAKMKAHYEAWWSRLLPTVYELVPVIVGSEQENPVLVTSNSWAGAGGINTQWAVAQNTGNVQGGTWHLEAVKGGVYRFLLSRWPPHLNRPMTVKGPAKAIGGTLLREGKAVPVAVGCARVDGGVIKEAVVKESDYQVAIEMELGKGPHELNAWFKDKEGKDVCAAYYVTIERIE